MVIGIDGSRAFVGERTGIEEYSYQVIKGLRDKLNGHLVILYIRHDQKIDFNLPKNWKVKQLWLPYFSSQIRFSFELLFHPVDVLFVLSHTVPPFHPKKTIVVIHGLEYEFVPKAYSAWARFYMPIVIKNSCRWAEKIISVSRNTKKDLINLYKVPEEKISVIYEGYETDPDLKNCDLSDNDKFKDLQAGYLLFVGRLEERKNIIGIIKTFELLKEKHGLPHKLVLAGKPGHGYREIFRYISDSAHRSDIILPGFISNEEKCKLFGKADVFMFPTFYEGFGLPILEAQSMGVPVVVSNISSVEEVADGSAVIVDPNEPDFIAERTNVLLKDRLYRDGIIKKGYENVKRFSWEKCADSIANLLTGQIG
jgi:glycosyltransferase involved in cell wall biosynthesis